MALLRLGAWQSRAADMKHTLTTLLGSKYLPKPRGPLCQGNAELHHLILTTQERTTKCSEVVRSPKDVAQVLCQKCRTSNLVFACFCSFATHGFSSRHHIVQFKQRFVGVCHSWGTHQTHSTPQELLQPAPCLRGTGLLEAETGDRGRGLRAEKAAPKGRDNESSLADSGSEGSCGQSQTEGPIWTYTFGC